VNRNGEDEERTTPTARGGSKPNGGNGNPVTLVRIAVARNKAIQALSVLPSNKP